MDFCFSFKSNMKHLGFVSPVMEAYFHLTDSGIVFENIKTTSE